MEEVKEVEEEVEVMEDEKEVEVPKLFHILNLCCSFNERDWVSHPYKIRCRCR